MELKERYNFKGVLQEGNKNSAWLEVFDVKGRKQRDMYLTGDQSAEQLRQHLAYAQKIEILEEERRVFMVTNLKALLGAFKFWWPDDPLIDVVKATMKRVENNEKPQS